LPVRRSIILAGGRGTRLHPLTFALPKPLVPVGERPVIDIVLKQLELAGVTRVTVAAGYMAGVLMAYLTIRDCGPMAVDYGLEQVPLGTAGPLAHVPGLDEPFFVLNGDLLTSLNFKELGDSHLASGADITLAACWKTHQVNLGVIWENQESDLLAYMEKPEQDYMASMGIYVMSPSVPPLIRKGERLDLPALVLRAKDAGMRVKVYNFSGYWRDIGSPSEYKAALSDFKDEDPLEKLTLDKGASAP